MKNLIWTIILVIICTGCQSVAEIPLNRIEWEIGEFSDLAKKPVSVILTNSEPNLIFDNIIYQQDYSEKAVQIATLIQTADKQADNPNIPFFILPEQLWIVFEDGTGSVFPYGSEPYTSIIRAADGICYSEALDDLIEWVRVCQVDNQQPKKIDFEQIQWEKGEFIDLKKEAIGLVISDAEPSLIFANIQYKDDLSEEASRIAYLFSNSSDVEEVYNWTSWSQYMWIVFKDGTGKVFECYDLPYDTTYIRTGNVGRKSEAAQVILNKVRQRYRIRNKILEGKKEPCPLSESSVF